MDTSIFKTERNQYRLAQLFVETCYHIPIEKRTISPVFTLYSDKEGFINFGKTYVELEDPTGWKVTQKLLNGDFNHWKKLMAQSWFKAAKTKWDEELTAKLQARGLDAIKQILATTEEEVSPAVRLQAAKFLAQKGFIQRETKASRGRPTNEEIEGELKRQAEIQSTISEDLARIGKKGA